MARLLSLLLVLVLAASAGAQTTTTSSTLAPTTTSSSTSTSTTSSSSTSSSSSTTSTSSTTTSTFAVITSTRGAFTALTAAAPASEVIVLDNYVRVTFLYVITGTATVQMEQSIDGGETWGLVGGMVTATATAGTSASSTNGFAISTQGSPVGHYRPNVTACSSCSVTVKWRAVRER